MGQIGNLTELVAPDGLFFTQKGNVGRSRVYVKKIVLAGNDTIDNWEYIKSSEVAHNEQITPPITSLDSRAWQPILERVGAIRNNDTGLYKFNGLDLTEEEMIDVYIEGPVLPEPNRPRNRKLRTTIGRNSTEWSQFRGDSFCWRCYNMEVLDLGYGYFLDKVIWSFYDCPKLRIVKGSFIIFAFASTDMQSFRKLPNLEEIRVVIYTNISIPDSPKLSYESVKYIVENCRNTTPITVTVHRDVYAKLTDPNNAEWNALVPAAQAKQITFATV